MNVQQKNQKDFLTDEVVGELLESATAAPSIHNSQPWQFAVGGRRIELYADPVRQLRVTDGSGRSLLISCGAALFNLRVAAEHLGFHPRIRMLPGADPTLVAVIDVDHRHTRAGLLDELYPAIWQRHTNRFPFRNRDIASSTMARLTEAVGYENAVLRMSADSDEVDRLVDLLRHAELEERENVDALVERAAWVAPEFREDGIPVHALGPLPVERHAAFRDLAVGGRTRPTEPFESTPTVAVLSTMHDSPLDWVRAGQALQRLLLVATNEGLSASFMNQPLEQHDTRWQVRSSLTGLGHTQMLMRIGYGTPVPPTPRRPVGEVLRRLAASGERE